MRRLAWLLFGLAVVLAMAFPQRRLLAVAALALVSSPPPLLEAPEEPATVRWFDDYFTIEEVAPRTFAIGEPRYAQQVYNYLVVGDERALLFDSGPGLRDIRPSVASLTALPVIAVPSHLHYDHIGNHARFERVAVVDLPQIRDRAPDGRLVPGFAEHLGFLEGIPRPELRVSEWWAPGQRVDLGGRSLEVLLTPGHTPESISLYEREADLLLAGDTIYPGPLIAIAPGSDTGDYLSTAEALAERLTPDTRILCAHRSEPPGAPILARSDVVDLRDALRGLRDGSRSGEGGLVQTLPVNARIELVIETPLFEDWE